MREVILMQSNKKEPKNLSVGIWKQTFPFFRPYCKEFATTFSLNILLILVDVAVPLFQSYAIDHFIVPEWFYGKWFHGYSSNLLSGSDTAVFVSSIIEKKS